MSFRKPRVSLAFLLIMFCIFVSCAQANALPDPFSPFNNGTNSTVQKILADNQAIFSIAGAIVGLFGLFAGYRLIFPVFALAGFCVAGFLSYELVLQLATGWQYEAYAAISALVIGGLAGAALMYNIIVLGVFGTGAALGLTISYAFKPVLLEHLPTQYGNWPFIIAAATLACIAGLVTLWLERPVLIAATSFGGAYAIVNAVIVFFGKQLATHFATPQDFHWMMLGFWVVISLIGMAVQFKITAAKKQAKWYAKRNEEPGLPLNRTVVTGGPVVGYQQFDQQSNRYY